MIFIYSSSDKAYGELNKRNFYKETDCLKSDYPYDVSKSASDLICQSYSKTYSLKIGIIRYGNIYGPGDFNLKRLILKSSCLQYKIKGLLSIRRKIYKRLCLCQRCCFSIHIVNEKID